MRKYAVYFKEVGAERIEVIAGNKNEALKEASNQWHKLHPPHIEIVKEIIHGGEVTTE